MDKTYSFSSVNGSDSAAGGVAPASAADGGVAGGAAPSGSDGGGAAPKPDGPGSAAPSPASSPQSSLPAGTDQPPSGPGHTVDWSKYNAEVERARKLETDFAQLQQRFTQAEDEIKLARRVQQYVPQQGNAPATPAQEAKADDLFAKYVAGGNLTEREKELVTFVQQERQAREGLEQRVNRWETQQAANQVRAEFASTLEKFPDLPQDVFKSMCLANPHKSISEIGAELARHLDYVHESRLSKRAAAPAGQAGGVPAGAPSRSPPVPGTGNSQRPAPAQDNGSADESDRDQQGRFVKRFESARESAMQRLGIRR